MQAHQLVSRSPGQLGLELRQLPSALPPGALLARARCTAISAGTEIANYLGRTRQRSATSRDPYLPGYSFAGVVLDVGADVTQFAPGDRICGPLPHASHAVEDRSEVLARIGRIPDGVSDRDAALSQLSCIALNGVRRAHIALGESVAVIGAGMVGQLAARFAGLSGARPLAVFDPLPLRRSAALAMGASVALGACLGERPEIAPHGFDVVIEATGHPEPVVSALRIAALGGRVVLLGSTRGLVEQFDAYGDVHLRGLTIVGAHVTTAPTHATVADRWTELANREMILEMMRDRVLDFDPLVTHSVLPEQVPEVYATLAAAPGEHLGVVVDWSDARFGSELASR